MKSPLKAAAPAVALALAVSFAPAVHAQTSDYVPPADELAEAMIIMEAMFPADTREQMMIDTVEAMGNQVAQSMMTGPIFAEPGIRAIMQEFLDDMPERMRPVISKFLPQMIKSTAIAYTREFTLEELQDIRSFATTSSGRRYFSSVQSMLNDPAVAAVNEKFFADVAELQQEQVQQIQGRLAEYLQANPEVLQRLEEAGVGRDD